ncbi:penicillin-binding protein 1A [Sinobacterium caligoides]|uniref:Penicillin-binding protein 1A n=1 Tax=Sinobacterium caligoides TaxID=933926 RepID=A0A3N2DQ67_9GAMM|nr:penicillin-binding protein 1A [Sinobacterium caligoides]ROS01958.1 penicillin-binding protein 1A [Sinobacterium caligoides]
MVSTRSIARLFSGLFITAFFGLGLVLSAAFIYLSPQLPSPDSLRDVELKTPLRVYTIDNKLIGEFGEERRMPINYQQIPPLFTKALLAAEDDGFYQHHGVDVKGLLRAASQLLMTGHIQSGGSTITMQVAKNYFLTHKRTFSRKFREILLALQIERELSKDEILELYVNKIFLGNRAYGIAAAAQVYYGKSIDELSIAQLAMIAGLPKAPSAYNPLANAKRALSRRNWILGRMHSLGYIDNEQFEEASSAPITAKFHGSTVEVDSPYIAEMARHEMIKRYGKEAYSKGLRVFTTVSSKLQLKAQKALVKGLKAYDHRHGYRGPEAHIDVDDINDIETSISALSSYRTVAGMQAALVTHLDGEHATILLKDHSEHPLDWDDSFSSLRPHLSADSVGAKPRKLADIISEGDIIRVARDNVDSPYRISQIPKVEGAIVAISPRNGAIQALVGGFDFRQSNFNRVLQAKRQPGSNFKPFIYSAALNAGYTPATIINDAPVVFEGTKLEDSWRPVNSSGNFYGPTRLRRALFTSRNLVSIRLLRKMGISNAINYMGRFGFDTKKMPHDLSLALGSYALTPLKLVTAYATLANGGYRVHPYLIQRIESSDGSELFTATPDTVCQNCEQIAAKAHATNDTSTVKEEAATLEELIGDKETAKPAELIMDPRVAYLIDSILKDVIKRGTGRRALSLKRNDIAGKTGTTNGPTDAWFSGYNDDIVTTTWVGFDRYNKLGRREYGGTAALPIWIDFMETALEDSPARMRQQPPGLISVRIDPETGELAYPQQSNAIFETFRAENVPARRSRSAGPNSQQQIENDLMLEDELF